MEKLEQLGLTEWHKEHVDKASAALHDIARVMSVHKDSYVISNGKESVFAELVGKMLYTAQGTIDLPTTGDWVYADFYDQNTHAIIHGLLPRRTLLKRKTPGKQVDYQLIAANIDVAFIIQSADENFNLRRLERYLVMVREAGITPIILLSKCDLATIDQLGEMQRNIDSIAPNVDVIAFSSETKLHLDTIQARLEAGKTHCLIGSSGVGKTTLLNELIGEDLYHTQSVSKKESKGRHTTTSRELILLKNEAIIIDTPGMRELGNLSVSKGIEETFSEIALLEEGCKFRNCTHANEKGCAIRNAIECGSLSEKRYQNYLKMKKEDKFNQMSYLEKRNKEKAFGKMIKGVMKNKKK